MITAVRCRRPFARKLSPTLEQLDQRELLSATSHVHNIIPRKPPILIHAPVNFARPMLAVQHDSVADHFIRPQSPASPIKQPTHRPVMPIHRF